MTKRTDEQREKYVRKLNEAVDAMRKASGLHKRDLIRYCWRLKKELAEYDRYHNLCRG